MMRTWLLSVSLILLGATLYAQVADSTAKNIPFLNADQDVDSLIQDKYAHEPILGDSVLPVVIDTTQRLISDIPDSVYIERLKRIPSAISLTYNDIVKSYIEVYMVRKRDKLQEMLGLKEYYFPMFEEILDAQGVPLELKYLSVIESALNPRAVSRCGATGLWQFMYGTGRLYKLDINSFVDERRDPVAATKAAANYLKDAYRVYGDWVLAIAAYNCGAGNVNKAIRRSGGKTNYWDIYPYLPKETRGYVPAFIAAAYAMNYYKDHNLTPILSEMPLEVDTIMISENLHLQQVSDVLHVPVEQLEDLNPQYRLDIIPGRFAASPLRLPVNLTGQFIDMQDSILRYKHDVFFSGDFKLINPTRFKSGKYASALPSVKNMQKIVYTVKTGDNLGSIATANKVKVTDLKYWNDINRNNIKVGQHLVIYVRKHKTEPTDKGAQKALTQKSPKNDTSAGDGYIYYQVKNGDSLWKIANQYPGVSDSDIRKWNNLTNKSKIIPGQTIKIKKIN